MLESHLANQGQKNHEEAGVRVKRDYLGRVKTFKVRLVAKGFIQEEESTTTRLSPLLQKEYPFAW
jgi:hypothetical protein